MIIEHCSSIRPTQESPETAQTGDIFFITLCAVICGADNWVSIETLGKAKEGWFDEVLGLENGIPSHDTGSQKAAIYMVSAWATQNQLVLGQQKVDDKSNEITAIPKLLMQLNITGAVVTIDAMGRQTKVAAKIIAQGADYMLSLKGNKGKLHKDVKQFFESENTCPAAGYESYDGCHGRIETRTVRASLSSTGCNNDIPTGWVSRASWR